MGITHAFCHIHFSRFIFTKCINRLHVSTSLETSVAFFFLTYSSPSFHLIAHPHNFLIRFVGRTRKTYIHVIARRLLFFFSAYERARSFSFLHSSGTSFLFLRLHRRSSTLSSSSSSPLLSSSSSPFHIHPATHTSYK
jgi:hypothetical protein